MIEKRLKNQTYEDFCNKLSDVYRKFISINKNYKYRQIIDEKNFTWKHVEYKVGDNKKQGLKIN